MGFKDTVKSFYRKNKKYILLALRIIISVSLIAFLIKTQFSDLKSALIILSFAKKDLILLSLSMHLVIIFITALRWKTLLNTQKTKLGFWTLSFSVAIGFFFNNFLPTSIGGDVFRTYDAAKKGKIRVGTSASIILVERFSGVISASIYAIIALFLGFTYIGSRPVIIPVIIFFVVTVIIAFLIINPHILRLERLFKRFKFLSRLNERVSNIFKTLISFKKYKWALTRVLAYSFIIQFAFIMNYYFAARALGIGLNLTTYIFIVPVVAGFAMIPISIGGIGLRENSLVFIMVAFGIRNEIAAVFSLILFAMLIFSGIIGGIIYIVRPYFENRFKKHSRAGKD